MAAGGGAKVAEEQSGSGDDVGAESEARPLDQKSVTPQPRRDPDISWAADNIPWIVLALLVLGLMCLGASSNDDITCPGGSTSCSFP